MHIESGAEALQMSCDTLVGSARQTNRLIQQLRTIRANALILGSEMKSSEQYSSETTVVSHIYGMLSSLISEMIITGQKKTQAMKRLH